MKFENYGLNDKQALPITLIMPYLSDMRKLIMKNCNLGDRAAGLILESTLGENSSLDHIDFTGVELGPHMIDSLRKVLTENSDCIKELIMSQIKSKVSIGELTEVLCMSKSLEYLDLCKNTFNHFSVDSLT